MKLLSKITILFLLFFNLTAFAAPIPSLIKKVVTFIYKSDDDGQPQPFGTGFFVGVNRPQRPESDYVFIATAKHVLQTDDKKNWLSKIFLRLNTKDGNSVKGQFDLFSDGPNKNIFPHPDPTVDIALIAFNGDRQIYDYQYIPEQLLMTRDDLQKMKIREGADIFFTGLFTPYIGEKRNYPIVRFGRMSLITDEKINFDGVKSDLFLMEANVNQGNSGAPAFFYLGIDREPGSITGGTILKLAGIVSGIFENKISGQNQGIAAIVPTYKLNDLVKTKEVVDFLSEDLSRRDVTNHKISFASVNGVKLHYLDWGGNGEPLLLIPQFGVSLHFYDDIASKFTDRFHIIGLTRRGQAESSKPLQGYDTGTLVQDIKMFLDFMKIDHVNLLGVIDAGNELTMFASQYPNNVNKLVYIDAAYDHSKLPELLSKHPSPPPPPPENSIEQLIRNGLFTFHPDYTKIKNPAVSFFFTVEYLPMIPTDADENVRKQYLNFFNEQHTPYRKEQIEKFRKEMVNGQVREITIQNFNDVGIQEIRSFLLSK